MYYVNPVCLQALRLLIAAISGITLVSNSDCKLLKELVIKKTKRQISEVVLMRFFGFIPGRFHPSVYTLDILANYCDYKDWKDFCEQHEETTPDTKNEQ